MKTPSRHWMQPKRVVAAVILEVLLAHAVFPAYATVSQIPGIYVPPPLPNVMYTLDDSGSMTSDAIPDFVRCTAGMPNSSSLTDSYNCGAGNEGGNGSQLPSMWKSGSGYLLTTYYRSDNAIARYMRSSSGNPLYYDPKVTYLPWPDKSDDTKRMANANVTAVNIDALDPTNTGRQLDLTTRQGTAGADDQTKNFWPATYFVYTDGVANPLPAANPNTTLNMASKFVKYEVKPSVTGYPRAAARTDCSGAVGATGCTYDQELQNFANWLQYYRSRMLMAKGGVSAAFALQGTNLRVGFTTINQNKSDPRRPVAQFSGSNRSGFYTDLYKIGNNGSTPLRKAMDDVGQYFLGTSTASPWAEDTSKLAGSSDSCRRSFHILSTDGFWNGNDASSPANNNNDDFTGSTPVPYGGTVGYTYTDSGTAGTLAGRFSVSPFNDNNAANVNTLADVAAYYWKTDLQTGIDNRISASTRDPAFWQHLTTFTVGLGISGTGKVRPRTAATDTNSLGQYIVPLTTSSASAYYPYRGQTWLSSQGLRDLLVKDKVEMIWTHATGDSAQTGDDLIHASINGHGRYFSATNPTELSTGIASALSEAVNQPQATANLATSSTAATAGTLVFQPTYNPYGWSGRLYAFPLASNGVVNTDPAAAVWEVSKAMPAPASRNIFTWNPLVVPKAATQFAWSSLNANQKTALGDSTVLDWVRGSSANEAQNGGLLRDRVRDTATGGVLGDIVGGNPIKGPDAGGGYQRMKVGTPGQDSYAAFRSPSSTTLDAMRSTLFFGANDGMLHAVNTANGVERFAYVPDSVFSVPRTQYAGSLQTVRKLKAMSDPSYNHLFTVNGAPQLADAYIGSSVPSWKTVLVASTGAGARSVFAMDVTNPVVGSGGFSSSNILWEFSGDDSTNTSAAAMGSVLNYPHVARMQDGTWVAMFGNGYDSASGQATLFLLNLQTGAVVWQQPVGTTGAGNGLSQPNFLLNSNREVVAIYAGDLKGNLWKFDVDSAVRADWKVAFSGKPLYAGNQNQPITVMPEISFPPSGGQVISFGTGKLYEAEDTATDATNVNRNTQAIFGIWDKPTATTGLTDTSLLVAQTLNAGTATGFSGTSSKDIDWATNRGWMLTLTGGASGERVNVNPSQQGNVLFVVANTPSVQPCSSGGSARIFALDPFSGKAKTAFDANRDGSINSSDKSNNVREVNGGILSLPRFLDKGNDGLTPESSSGVGATGAEAGGKEKDVNGCSGGNSSATLVAGVSDTTTASEKVQLCDGKGRVTWRQIR
ncbi:pilus assembly protein [Rhizobacter sp. P5_C2]